MPYREFTGQNCSIARALAVVGERWTLLVMREVLLGRRRFREIQRQTGVAPNILSDRLDTLVAAGVLRRDGEEYAPTRKGVDLTPVLAALMDWGDRYESPVPPPRVRVHADCGRWVRSLLRCEHCDTEVEPADLRMRAGPGATPAQRAEGMLPAGRHEGSGP